MKRLLILTALSSIFLGACGAGPAREIAPPTTTQVPSPAPINTPVPLPSATLAPTGTPLPPMPTETVSPYLFQDEFDGSLGEGWRWIGEDPTKWSLTQAPGSIRIILSPAHITEGEPKNFLLRESPAGNFELETLVRFTPTTNFQFAGLLIYQSQGNAMQFGRAYADCSNPSVCLRNAIYFDLVENRQAGKPNYSTVVQNPSQAYLRLRREGTSYTGYYSDNGTDWVFIGKHESTIDPLFVGLIGSQAFQAETTADFEYFTIQALP